MRKRKASSSVPATHFSALWPYASLRLERNLTDRYNVRRLTMRGAAATRSRAVERTDRHCVYVAVLGERAT